ncbi:hypothetical protein BH23GEM9_BH23GEM9_34220 [soil metagenome]
MAMRLHRLRLTWFRNFIDADFAFGDGLCVVIGDNGTGKSTLIEAIIWSLYGPDRDSGQSTSARTIAAPGDAVTATELHLSIATEEYRIHRTRAAGASDARVLTADGECLVEGDEAVTAWVTTVLGAGRDLMVHACRTGRTELKRLTQHPPTEEMRVLERELADADERVRTLASAPELLAQYTTELERLRPELAAAETQAERLHDEWSQRRQDVDTKLAVYRTRGDEIRLQIERLTEHAGGACPTCRRPLGDHLTQMIERLDDESYVNAQDAKWLVQRQAQLARKPPELVEADTLRGRLRATVNDRQQRAARCEQAAQELWTVAGEKKRAAERLAQLRHDMRSPLHGPAHASSPVSDHDVGHDVKAIEELARRHVAVISDGSRDAGGFRADGRVIGHDDPAISDGDEDMVAFALRLAVMQTAQQANPRLGLLLFDAPFGSMDARRTRRAVGLLRTLRDEHPQILLCTGQPGLIAAGDSVLHLETTDSVN